MKKLLCLLLTALLLLSLAGCKTASQDPENPGTSEESTGSTETGTETADTTESSQNQQEEIPATKIVYLCTEEAFTDSYGGSLTVRTYDEKGNLLTQDYKSNSGDDAFNEAYTYDESGNVLTYKSYDKYSGLTKETTYTYNDAGQLVSQLFTSKEDAFSHTEKSDFTYREDGLLIKKVATYPADPGNAVHLIYSYDDNGNLIKEEWINVNDGVQTPHSWKAWTYDEKGNKLSETDNRGFKTEWTYDDRGNMLSEEQYNDRGDYWKGVTYTYDKQNRVLTESFTKGAPSAISEAFIYEYDNDGHEIARYRCYDAVDKANAVRVFKSAYDEFGNKVSEIGCKPDGTETSRTTYKYIAIELPNPQKES